MYGYAMTATAGELQLVLRPYQTGEHAHLLPGMQSYHVLGHTSFRRAFTAAEAEAYIARLEASQTEIGWAICVVTDGLERPIGTTTLEPSQPFANRAETGIVIYDRSWWGKGVAKLAHLARTKYAFEVMNLEALTSGADQTNHGSRRALEHIGYVHTGVNYHVGVIKGAVVHADRFLLVNPADGPWQHFWGTSTIPAPFVAARRQTLARLDEASTQVVYR